MSDLPTEPSWEMLLVDTVDAIEDGIAELNEISRLLGQNLHREAGEHLQYQINDFTQAVSMLKSWLDAKQQDQTT